MLNPSFYGTFGHTDTMVHEIGHSLGLYHVFRGISEIESCNDACLETEPSMETGDLCADTNPTPKYKGCNDPDPGNETCGCQHFTHTPFNNYMSYAGELGLPRGFYYLPEQNLRLCLSCAKTDTEITAEEFVESMCMRDDWNFAGKNNWKNTAGGTSFYVSRFTPVIFLVLL